MQIGFNLPNSGPLSAVPSGLEIHNIEMNPGQGGKLEHEQYDRKKLMQAEGCNGAWPTEKETVPALRCHGTPQHLTRIR